MAIVRGIRRKSVREPRKDIQSVEIRIARRLAEGGFKNHY